MGEFQRNAGIARMSGGKTLDAKVIVEEHDWDPGAIVAWGPGRLALSTKSGWFEQGQAGTVRHWNSLTGGPPFGSDLVDIPTSDACIHAAEVSVELQATSAVHGGAYDLVRTEVCDQSKRVQRLTWDGKTYQIAAGAPGPVLDTTAKTVDATQAEIAAAMTDSIVRMQAFDKSGGFVLDDEAAPGGWLLVFGVPHDDYGDITWKILWSITPANGGPAVRGEVDRVPGGSLPTVRAAVYAPDHVGVWIGLDDNEQLYGDTGKPLTPPLPVHKGAFADKLNEAGVYDLVVDGQPWNFVDGAYAAP
jgi:hypothetical protein